jgi:hypothetical protein
MFAFVAGEVAKKVHTSLGRVGDLVGDVARDDAVEALVCSGGNLNLSDQEFVELLRL